MKIQWSDTVLEVTLNSPKTRNAFSIEDARALKTHLKNKKISAVILKAIGPVFCAGGNLAEYARLKSKAQGTKMNKDIADVLNVLAQLPVPKLAVVDGDCYGGGVELLSCFDWIVATPKSFFALWQRRMTLSFGWGGYARLLNRMPQLTIKSWVQSADVKSAYWAHSQGLVNEILHEKNIDNFIECWKTQQKLLTSESYQEIQKLTAKNERRLFDKLWWSKAHREKLSRSNNRK